MLIRGALLLLACACVLLGQSIEAYESFFLQVANLGPGGKVLLNGQPSNFVSPRLQDAIGLTDEEAVLLMAIAKDFQSKYAAVTAVDDGALRRATWEARLAAVAGETQSALEAQVLAQQVLAQMTRQRAQLVGDLVANEVQQLKSRWGDTRFQIIRDFINSRNDSKFFPLVK